MKSRAMGLAFASLAPWAGSCTQAALRSAPWALQRWGQHLQQRCFSAEGKQAMGLQNLFLSDITTAGSRTPLTLGFFNYFERHIPNVGFFVPIGGPGFPGSKHQGVDHYVELMHRVFQMQGDPHSMVGVSEAEAAKLIASGKTAELLDRIYAAYINYKEGGKDFILVQGPSGNIGGTELDAIIAQALSAPVLLTMQGNTRMTANDYYNLAVVKRGVFTDHKVDVAGVAINNVPRTSHALLTNQLRERLLKEGLAFAGGIPQDPVLAGVRLDEVQAALSAELLFGHGKTTLDKEFSHVIVASQRVEELLEALTEQRSDTPPLVVTSQDRMDIVLACLAAQLSIQGPTVAGVLLTQAGHAMEGRRYARDAVSRIFTGLQDNQTYTGSLMPVLLTHKPMFDVLGSLKQEATAPSILPTSARKITQAKMLFDRYIDANAVVSGVQHTITSVAAMTPKMFTHNLKAMCLKNPQRIVLPESTDKRVLTAAAEVAARGLARVILLGSPATTKAEAAKLGLDLNGVTLHDPESSDRIEKYVDALVEARKKKGLPRETALDMIKGDINTYGTMMVACGDADGMVSGAMHTTAATIRPAMQVLRVPDQNVSSVFFMCLPDKVLVYGDCAVNVNPTAKELAQIAAVSADTAAAFGLKPPRVAMLSYSTLGSGAGPDVQKVTEAVALVKQARPDIKVEGPIQYDAAIDPKVAAVKIKTPSEVAGKATVFIFPDLNTGNNTYKAVQQASGGIAMGPVMQGLSKPVNDLSRGCTVPDIVNTVCVTSIQAMNAKNKPSAPAAAA